MCLCGFFCEQEQSFPHLELILQANTKWVQKYDK